MSLSASASTFSIAWVPSLRADFPDEPLIPPFAFNVMDPQTRVFVMIMNEISPQFDTGDQDAALLPFQNWTAEESDAYRRRSLHRLGRCLPIVAHVPRISTDLVELFQHDDAKEPKSNVHTNALKAGQFIVASLSEFRDINPSMSVRILRLPPRRNDDEIQKLWLGWHAGNEAIIPLNGEVFCRFARVNATANLENESKATSFEHTWHARSGAGSGPAHVPPEVMFLRSDFPHMLFSLGDHDVFALHVRFNRVDGDSPKQVSETPTGRRRAEPEGATYSPRAGET